jgi:2'-5' RNA ligase
VATEQHHATIFVPPAAAGPSTAARRRWDPVMAAQIDAHVTLAYPREAPSRELLIERLHEVARRVAPFRLQLGRLGYHERPEAAVYVEVVEVDGGYARMREALLGAPFRPSAHPPHVTIVHPRTSTRGRECWERGAFAPSESEFTVEDVTVTAFDGARWVVLARCRLEGQRVGREEGLARPRNSA